MLLPLFMAVGIATLVILPIFVPNLYMVCRQMLLPYGWCYCHVLSLLLLEADVIALWLMLATFVCYFLLADVICHVADGIATICSDVWL